MQRSKSNLPRYPANDSRFQECDDRILRELLRTLPFLVPMTSVHQDKQVLPTSRAPQQFAARRADSARADSPVRVERDRHLEERVEEINRLIGHNARSHGVAKSRRLIASSLLANSVA